MNNIKKFNALKAYPKTIALTEEVKHTVHELMDNGVVLTGDPVELVAAVLLTVANRAQAEKTETDWEPVAAYQQVQLAA